MCLRVRVVVDEDGDIASKGSDEWPSVGEGVESVVPGGVEIRGWLLDIVVGVWIGCQLDVSR